MSSVVSHAVQAWRGGRAVAVLATIALAVGIGSATAIYTVVNGVMLKPLPYGDGERFVALFGARFSEPEQRSAHPFPDLIEYQQRTRSFDVFGWFRPGSFTLIVAGQPPQHVDGAAVTPSLARNLGVNPVIGQWFDNDQGAVISSALWRRLGADPGIIGKALTVDGRTFVVTGVMPPAFRLPVPSPGLEGFRSDVWMPLDPLGRGMNPTWGAYFSYARRKPGVTLGQAEADVKRVAAEIAALNAASHPSYTARLDDLRESVLLTIKPTLMLLIGAAGLLLLITCADVAGLLLARSVARARETAVRLAIGASHRQLAFQYLMEGLIVSLGGAAAGVAVSVLLVRTVVAIASAFIPRADEIAIDWSVLLFAIVVACATGALASLAPLWQATRTAPADVLGDGVRTTASARSRRVSRALVVAEIALAFTLLASSAVLLVHLRNLTRVSPGFNANDLLTFALTPSQVPAHDASRFQQEARLVSALEGIPGVTSAAYTNQLPLDGCCLSTTIYPDGSEAHPNSVQRISFLAVSPGYFRTLQLPLHSGRYLDERDVKPEPTLVVINEAAARFFWPGKNPVDAYGRFGGSTGDRFQVVGVVGDVRNDGLGKATVPEIYLSSAHLAVNPMRFLVRSALPSATLVPEIRRAIQSVNASQPIHNVTTIGAIVHDSVSLERVGSFMIGCFAVAALLMAALGVYGVVSYAVRQGTVEFGTRMALGAVGRDLLVLVVGGGLRMAAYGAAIGAIAVVAAAWALVRLFEIRDLGVLPFISSTGIVAGVATVASFVPAWRVTRLSPMVAIRNEPSWEWESARRSIRETLGKVVRAVSLSDEVPRATSEDLVTELVAAARGASSFTEAFHQALATLCNRLGSTSAMLLEHRSGEYRPIASIPADAQPVTLPADGFLVNRLQYYGYPLPFSAADIDSWRQWSRDNDLGHETELDALSASGARIAIGLRARTDILGVLLLGAPTSGAKYSSADKRLLRQCSDELTLMIENARLTTRVVEQEKLRRDVALAAEVQRRLLPERPPARSTVSLEAISLPARTVGGDYYDFLELGDQKIGIALADVAGKGVAAALLMAVVQASLRSVTAEGGPSVSQLASRLNDLLQRSTASNSYATFFYAQFDERSRRLDYVNAGHNPPYLVRAPEPQATVEIVELSVGGTVLGLFPQMSYEEAAVALRPGDVLVAYTDGVTEALNGSEEEFGEERLKTLLRDLVHRSAPEISSGISTALRTWIKDTPQHDDLTFVVMKVH